LVPRHDQDVGIHPGVDKRCVAICARVSAPKAR
jgi:hypothetical protein